MATRPTTITLILKVGDTVISTSPANLRTFSSGKKGYGVYGKASLPNGEPLQMSCNLVIPHSENEQ